MFKPERIIVKSSAADDEILVAGVDENDKPKNVTIRDADLHAQLIATPEFVKNAGRIPLENEAFAAAVEQDARSANPA